MLALSLPVSIMKTCSVVLTFKSVDENLWFDHSNETSLAGLLRGAIVLQYFIKWNLGVFLNLIFGTLKSGAKSYFFVARQC